MATERASRVVSDKKRIRSGKKPTIKQLIKKLDAAFQTYVRYRDNFTCITCGKRFDYGEHTLLHAGHYISRGVYATRWDEKNVNAQCASCNLRQSLADVEVIHRYELALKAKYGADVLEYLFTKRHEPFKLTRGYLEEKIEYYQELIKKSKKCNFFVDN